MSRGRHPRATRFIGIGTVAFGLGSLALPGVTARVCGLDPGETSTRLVTMTLGTRDVVSGAAILTARDRGALRRALLMRGLFDAGDAAACATTITNPLARRAMVVGTSAWGALALSLAATA